jgi:predicted nucleotidyltransferase
MSHLFSTDEIKAVVVPIARKYGVERVMLFGSHARNKEWDGWGIATPKSDVDLRIDIERGWGGYFKLASLHHALEEALGVRVDLLTTDALDSEFLEDIAMEEIVLYEQRKTKQNNIEKNNQIL